MSVDKKPLRLTPFKLIAIAITALFSLTLAAWGIYRLGIRAKRDSQLLSPQESLQCKTAINASQKVMRFFQVACNYGRGDVEACHSLSDAFVQDSMEQQKAWKYYINALWNKCSQAQGRSTSCDELLFALPDNFPQKKQVGNDVDKLLIKNYELKCDKGEGEPEHCEGLYRILKKGEQIILNHSIDAKKAQQYYDKALLKKYGSRCTKDNVQLEACHMLADELSPELPQSKLAWKNYDKAMKNMEKMYYSKCRKGHGALEDCQDLYKYVMRGADSCDEGNEPDPPEKKYYLKALNHACDQGKGEVETCLTFYNMYQFFLNSFPQKKQAKYYYFKALDKKCAKGKGDLSACEEVFSSEVFRGPTKWPWADVFRQYYINGLNEKCAKGAGDLTACNDLADFYPESSAQHQQAKQYYQKLQIKTYGDKCDQGKGDPEYCRGLSELYPLYSAESIQSLAYERQALTHSCLDQNNEKNCKQLIEEIDKSDVPLRDQALSKLENLCLEHHNYAACKMVIQHYRETQRHCF